MVKDIISGDSAKAQLKLIKDELNETKKQSSVKDSIIFNKDNEILKHIEKNLCNSHPVVPPIAPVLPSFADCL